MKNRWNGFLVLMVVSLFGCDSGAAAPQKLGEGVGSSGGGIGVQCGARLQTLDLYEAQNVHHLTLESPEATFDQNIVKFSRRFMDYYSVKDLLTDEQILAELQKSIVDKFREVLAGSLTLSQDATLPEIPASCRFVQIALYDDAREVIYLDPRLWAQLPPQEQTALVMHESLYRTAREFHAHTSDEARRVIGIMFSTTPLPPLYDFTENQRLIHCMSPSVTDSNDNVGTTHWASFGETIENGVPGLRGYFLILNGSYLLSRATSFIPGLTLNGALAQGFPPMQIEVIQPLTQRYWVVHYEPGRIDPNYPGQGFELNVRSALVGTALPQNSERVVCFPNQMK